MNNVLNFISDYPTYVGMLEDIVKPEYYPIIKKMYETDPHELITPDHLFTGNGAMGLVLAYFNRLLNESKK